MSNKYHDPNFGLTNYISDFASNLKKYGRDVLQGNFEIFPQLDKIVKERLKNYQL